MNPPGYTESPNSCAPTDSYNLWQDSQYFHFSNLNIHSSQSNTSGKTSIEIGRFSPNLSRDEKNRRIITKEKLYEDPENFNIGSVKRSESIMNSESNKKSSPSTIVWTDAMFHKKGDFILSDDFQVEAGSSPKNEEHSEASMKTNIEQSIENALPEKILPKKLSKAESMMHRMGWQGGALGRDGSGIMAPIIPNTDYTGTCHQGLGNKDVKLPDKISSSETFITNVLLTILDFLKNEFEIEVVFQNELFPEERKQIQKIVTKLRHISLYDYNLESQMEVVSEIKKCKQFILGSTCHGKFPNRRLSIYKEAPKNMLLVTPIDLRQDSLGSNKNINTAKCVTNTNILTKSFDKPNVSITNLAAEKLIAAIAKVQAKPDVEDAHIETDDFEDEDTNPFLRSITRNLRKRTVPETDIKTDETATAKNKDTIITADKTLNAPEVIEKASEKPKDVEVIEIDSKRVLDIRETIIGYFIQFCNTRKYVQFRFLGPFNDEELVAIRGFVKDLRLSLAEPQRSLEIFADRKIVTCLGYTYLKVTEDTNGHCAINKQGKR